MSFSSAAKEEICAIHLDDCCVMAELCAVTFVCGNVNLSSGGVKVRYNSENIVVAKRIYQTLTQVLKIESNIEVKENALKKKRTYSIVAHDGALLLQALGMEGNLFLTATPPAYMTQRDCCAASLVRGAFLGGGTVSDPKKSYHLEFVINSGAFADFLLQLLQKFEIRAKKFVRKQNYVVYLNEGDSIVDLLALIGAHSSILQFENVRILKEMRNNVNRAINCETANMDKTINAALAQLESIRTIEKKAGLDSLSPPLREAANLRLQHPEATLQELCELANATKSGMNHRMRKLKAIAQEL